MAYSTDTRIVGRQRWRMKRWKTKRRRKDNRGKERTKNKKVRHLSWIHLLHNTLCQTWIFHYKFLVKTYHGIMDIEYKWIVGWYSGKATGLVRGMAVSRLESANKNPGARTEIKMPYLSRTDACWKMFVPCVASSALCCCCSCCCCFTCSLLPFFGKRIGKIPIL